MEPSITPSYNSASRYLHRMRRRCGEPIANSFNGFSRIPTVSCDVLTGNIGDELLITISVNIENQTSLRAVFGRAEAFCAQKESQFEWHVEAWKLGISVWFRSRNIVNAELAG